MDDNKKKSTRRRDITTWLIAGLFVYGLSVVCWRLSGGKAPVVVRELSYSTGGLEVRQVYEFPRIGYYVSEADKAGVFYAISQSDMFAFDTFSGEYLWQSDRCTGRDGVYTIIVSDTVLYGATALGIYACEVKSGEYIWSTTLGTGHVAVIPQLEPDVSILRVYYGDIVYELEPSSGEIVDKYSKGDLRWKAGQVGIYSDSRDTMKGRDLETGEVIWENREAVFWVGEWHIPLQLDSKTLLVKVRGGAVCSFDFTRGVYNWCSAQEYISNLGVDNRSMVGYIIRSDFALVEIDLQTGTIVSETGFSPSRLSENDHNVYWYFTAATEESTILAFFGDSKQLFVLSR
ncbi:MAG: PQQ-binding-like beta-propeller repeat protein [Anaerolineales bacterium]|nr:PQQ-binding-like beta-propeller repeat protein [Anaerolineales bacterium]